MLTRISQSAFLLFALVISGCSQPTPPIPMTDLAQAEPVGSMPLQSEPTEEETVTTVKPAPPSAQPTETQTQSMRGEAPAAASSAFRHRIELIPNDSDSTRNFEWKEGMLDDAMTMIADPSLDPTLRAKAIFWSKNSYPLVSVPESPESTQAKQQEAYLRLICKIANDAKEPPIVRATAFCATTNGILGPNDIEFELKEKECIDVAAATIPTAAPDYVVAEIVGKLPSVSNDSQDPRIVQILIKSLSHSSYWVRVSAANSIANCDPEQTEEAIPKLVDVLTNDIQEIVQDVAANALGRIGKRPEICLKPLLQSHTYNSLPAAAHVVMKSDADPQPLFDRVEEVLQLDPDTWGDVQLAYTLEILGKKGEPLVAAMIPVAQGDPIMASAMASLGPKGEDAAFPILIKFAIDPMSTDDDVNNAMVGFEGMREAGPKIAKSAEQMLNETNNKARVLQMMANFGEPMASTAPIVAPYTKNKDSEIRRQALDALISFGSPSLKYVDAMKDVVNAEVDEQYQQYMQDKLNYYLEKHQEESE